MNVIDGEKPYLYDGLEKFEQRINDLETQADQILNNVNCENQKIYEKIEDQGQTLRKCNAEIAGVQANAKSKNQAKPLTSTDLPNDRLL